MGNRRYTLEEFRAAAENPSVVTIADLCRAVGIVPRGANYEGVRAYARYHDIDLARLHVRTRRHDSFTDAELRAALARSDLRGYADLCKALGVDTGCNTYRRIRRHGATLGIDMPAEWSRRPQRYGGGRRPSPNGRPRHDAKHGQRRSCAFDHEALAHALALAPSIADALRALNQPVNATSYRRVQRCVAAADIELSHMGNLDSGGKRATPLEEILINGRRYSSTQLRERLLIEQVKEHRCEKCGRAEWEGVPIPLELDHVNGDRADNRLANLRLLCPNCHALTPTYRGRNVARLAA